MGTQAMSPPVAAELEGTVKLKPNRDGPVRAGDYEFPVGTAGSCMLVLQTVWPALMLADGPSTLHLSGGTHNPMAPPFHFLARAFAPLMERPEARALWWPRFQRIAGWFGDWETARRATIATIEAEIRGEIAIPLDDGRSFALSARADRVERRRSGSYAILDYKTGQPPTGKQVRMGLSPQLTLEAAILREGGFPDIPAGSSVEELVYVRLSGNNPPGEERALRLTINKSDTPQTPDAAATEALRKLETLIRTFDDEDQAYTSLNLPMWTNRYGTYDDLARIKEWSAAGGLGLEEW